MTTYTYTAAVRRNDVHTVDRPVGANALVSPGVRVASITNAATGSGSTVDFNLRIPTHARILPSSKFYNDDLATSGSPAIKLGFRAVEGNITTTLNALNASIALSTVSTANTGMNVLGTTLSNYGKKVWELLSLASDPGGFVDVVGTTITAATTATGNVALDMHLGFN